MNMYFLFAYDLYNYRWHIFLINIYIYNIRIRYSCRRKTPSSGKKTVGQLGTFTKEIILLTSPTDCKVVRQGTKQMLYQQGHILSAVELHKEWTAL